jgi:hypothetical protein
MLSRAQLPPWSVTGIADLLATSFNSEVEHGLGPKHLVQFHIPQETVS